MMAHGAVSDGVTGLPEPIEVAGALAAAMIESSRDGVLLVDEFGVIRLANRQIDALFGHHRDDVVGCPIERLFPARGGFGDLACDPHGVALWSRDLGNDPRETARRADGTEFIVEVSLVPIATDGGLRIMATIRDVTEAVEIEAHWHVLFEMIEAAHDGVFIFTLDTLEFTYVNHGAELQLGYTRDDLLSMSLLQIEPEFTEHSFVEPLVGGAVDSVSFTTVHRNKDGTCSPVEVVLDYPSPVGPRKRRLVIAMVRDITERLQREEAIRCSEASLRLLDERERLARDLHDLVIQRLFAAGVGLQAIHSSITDERVAKRVADTVTELDLTISELRSAIFHLTTVTRASVASRTRDIIDHASVVLGFVPTITFDGDPETITNALREQLVPVLTEAMSNVARHARATRVAIAIKIGDGVFEVVVADNGVGIDGGAVHGNGLRNLRKRAHSNGGNLTVESRTNNGTMLVWTSDLGCGERPTPADSAGHPRQR